MLRCVPPDLPSLDISYEWGHTICGILCLLSLTQNRVFEPIMLQQMLLSLLSSWVVPPCTDLLHGIEAPRLMETWAVSMFWLLRVTPLFTGKTLCANVSSFLLGTYEDNFGVLEWICVQRFKQLQKHLPKALTPGPLPAAQRGPPVSPETLTQSRSCRLLDQEPL